MKNQYAIRSFFSRWFPVIVCMGIIFISSADYNPYRWLPPEWFEKSAEGGLSTDDVGQVGHFLEYTLLGLTMLRAVVWKKEVTLKLIMISAALCAAYALSDEIHQTFVPGRAFQIQDLLIDGGGIMLGLYMQYLFSKYTRN